MKKTVLLLALTTALLCGGCSPKAVTPIDDDEVVDDIPEDNPEEGKKADTDKSGRKKIKIQFHVDSKSVEGVAYKKRVDAFNAAYSDKYVVSASFKARTQGGTDYELQLIAQQLDGTLPDIITFDAPNCASYAKSVC